MGLTKVLREKVLCRSLSSIHILYNQALVGGLSTSLDPGTRIVNLPLNGGSTHLRFSSIRITSQDTDSKARVRKVPFTYVKSLYQNYRSRATVYVLRTYATVDGKAVHTAYFSLSLRLNSMVESIRITIDI